MSLRNIILPVALMAACTAGPESPNRYRRFGPVTTLTFNFVDVPPGVDIEAANLDLRLVNFQPSLEAPHARCEEEAGSATLRPFVAQGAEFVLPSIQTSRSSDGIYECQDGDLGAMHFLKVIGRLDRGSSADGMAASFSESWTPGAYDLVYAYENTIFMPFGPAGASVTIPEGYSWLHRTCGAAGNTEFSIVPISETVDLHRGSAIPNSDPATRSMSIAETIERGLATCGGPPPARDLGTRASFDQARELVWSADGTSLFYLAADEQDPNGAVGGRQVKLLEHTTSEIIVVNHASALQTGASGGIYVTADATTYAVTLATGLPATLQPLPFTGTAHLSPDGLWFAYDGGGAVHLWSVSAAAEVATLPGGFLTWSPDSRLLYADNVPAPYPLFVVSPSAPEQVAPCGALPDFSRMEVQLAWPSECPQVAYAPSGWFIESTIPYPDCKSCFGLSLQDPVTGVERPLLDPSLGKIHLVDTHPVADAVFTWVRNCQGLYNTVCSHSLLRVRLSDGTAETIAIADQELPVALSWDGRRLALAASNGIYVKDLPP